MSDQELGPLEVRVLGLLRREATASVGTIRDGLEREGSALAYTTVMTVLTRLHHKQLVVRTREGNRYLYACAASAPRVLGGMLARVRRALSPSSRAHPILQLLEEEDLSPEELRELRRAVNRKIEEQKR